MWDKELKVARQAARDAGKTLKDLFGRVAHVTKKGKTDLVTEADFEAEKIIMDMIRQRFPQDGIVAERRQLPGADAATWLEGVASNGEAIVLEGRHEGADVTWLVEGGTVGAETPA